ncbi:MAG: single-stranded DNA-binding protein [bacterium]
MASLNRIILVGRLTADPESRSTADGAPIAKFRLAVNRPVGGQGAENGVDLIDVVAWSKLAEICAQYLKKDRLVLVEGRTQVRSYEDQAGQRKWVTEVVARNMTMLDKPGQEKGSAVPVNSSVETETIDDDPEMPNDLPF